MSLYTIVGRVTDGLVLCCSSDESGVAATAKSQARQVLRSLDARSAARCVYDAGSWQIHVAVECGVAYLVIVPRSFPKQLAFAFLDAVHQEFWRQHGQDVALFSRPFAAAAFDGTLQRLQQQFADPHSPSNAQRVSQNLAEIHSIMRQNISDVMERGERLDRVQERSQSVRHGASRFARQAKITRYRAMLRQWAPAVVCVLVMLLVLWLRFF
ncbi:MAG: hypothetical protein MHM6MM_008019 [Cercozoa sp. M6MM]